MRSHWRPVRTGRRTTPARSGTGGRTGRPHAASDRQWCKRPAGRTRGCRPRRRAARPPSRGDRVRDQRPRCPGYAPVPRPCSCTRPGPGRRARTDPAAASTPAPPITRASGVLRAAGCRRRVAPGIGGGMIQVQATAITSTRGATKAPTRPSTMPARLADAINTSRRSSHASMDRRATTGVASCSRAADISGPAGNRLSKRTSGIVR